MIRIVRKKKKKTRCLLARVLKMKKQTTKKEGNQEANLRENINSDREEQSVKPQHWDQSKIVSCSQSI